MERNKLKTLDWILIIVFFIAIFSFISLSLKDQENKGDNIQQYIEETQDIVSGSTQEIQNNVESLKQEIEQLKQEIAIDNKGFILKKNSCDFEYTGTYKYLDLYSGGLKTQKQKPNINEYTKEVSIYGNIDEVKICIIADVRNDHKGEGDYYFEVKAYLGSNLHEGYINVGYSHPYLYDNDSKGARNKELYGKFYGNETPFRQILDTEKVIIADINGGEYYKYIRPIVNFQKEGTIRLGAYVEGDTHWYAGNISEFRIIYKGEGTITNK